MNIRDLKYLVAVSDFKSFRKAAESVYVSQPTLSMQIKKLEEFLQVTLIERTNKKVLITPIGQQIVEKSRRILEEVDNITELAKISKNPLTGELKLGAFPTIAPYLFPLVIGDIKQKLPSIKLHLVEEKTENLISKLKEGKIDVAFLALPVNENELESKSLFNEDFYLAVPRNHKLAKRKNVTHSDIENEKLMLLEDGHCLREQALDVCAHTGAMEDRSFRGTSLETLRSMVAAGSGITLVPKLALREDKNVVYIPFSKPTPHREIGLVWRKSSARKDLFSKIISVIDI